MTKEELETFEEAVQEEWDRLLDEEEDDYHYVLGGISWFYCIPYEGNEHLCGKVDDCNEYFKTWK